jgi:hypothetical protein
LAGEVASSSALAASLSPLLFTVLSVQVNFDNVFARNKIGAIIKISQQSAVLNEVISEGVDQLTTRPPKPDRNDTGGTPVPPSSLPHDPEG